MANNDENNIAAQLKPLFPEHDFNKLYYKQNIVTFTINGELGFYQAIRNVPRFVPITDRRYWNLLTTGEGNFDDEEDQSIGPDYLCFTANKAGAQLMITGGHDTSSNDKDTFNLEYSTDKETWSAVDFTIIEGNDWDEKYSNVFIFENIGDKIYFRGNNINGTAYMEDGFVHYGYYFCSPPDSQFENNEFSVSGDLQTIVDETGNDKEHGCFCYLFSYYDSPIYITTAPDLTSTKLINNKYCGLFYRQSLLEHPANMTIFTIEDINNIYSAFSEMYCECSSLLEAANFDMIVSDVNDVNLIENNFYSIYYKCGANVTNDGFTLIGFTNTNFPINTTVGGESVSTDSFIFASNIFNSTKGFIGFTIEIIYGYSSGDVILDYEGFYIESTFFDGYNTIKNYLFKRQDILRPCTLIANAYSGYRFLKWQVVNDDEETVDDINASRFATAIPNCIKRYVLSFEETHAEM